MAKIQARNVDDALFARIEQSAMKNERSLEGEIRLALARQYPDVTVDGEMLTGRQRWQKECGGRLLALFGRLSSDGVLPGSRHDGRTRIADLVRIAQRLNVSPGLLMDCAEGEDELTRDLAERLETTFGAGTDWLTTGDGMMFPLVTLGTYSGVSWQTFFFPDGDERYVFELIRITGGRHDGTLMILRQNEKTGAIATGLVTEAFYLGAGMGSGGYGSLKAFLLFLNAHCRDLVMNAYVFEPPEADFDFWSVMGQHHPVWFRDANRRSPSRWLQQVLSGEDPGEWFAGGWTSVLEEVASASREALPGAGREGEPE
ncbi:hypothetical protein [Enterobacter sp. JBIWA005]|uniref:hypothetical protein n=1 Tax=Enterobacter sp. JBIWA005 TaxID=2831891 RepID=UPI001CBFE376|nr:hypothetical protein [Enterobacter sp. JBIWA005]UAN34322.1 hypothetical protein KGP22_23410 [Enterobacter sp. JBIWA005]